VYQAGKIANGGGLYINIIFRIVSTFSVLWWILRVVAGTCGCFVRDFVRIGAGVRSRAVRRPSRPACLYFKIE
jgi:hypothetical protein